MKSKTHPTSIQWYLESSMVRPWYINLVAMEADQLDFPPWDQSQFHEHSFKIQEQIDLLNGSVDFTEILV
jgi:hypothetical protein